MKLEWMGEHREIVEALIRYCNIYAAVYRAERMSYEGITYSYSQIQVLEYLLENEERGENMSSIAHRLGITRSNFTKIINRLAQKGLVEKCRMPGSRRDLCVRVNDLGRVLYDDYSKGVLKRHFEPMFRELDKLSPEARIYVRDALRGRARRDPES
ncbi:MAG: MarR family transcriptional regulator [Clostridia bacterium]|nr:MarR family transcriptional regulator [Clostridia bacterium]